MEEIKYLEINNHRIAAVIHHANSKKIVIMCHGFQGTKIGPHRNYVRLARTLCSKGINVIRFDQYCSGDSEGDFKDSRFNDWVETTRKIVQDYLDDDYEISLVGFSMGASTTIVVSSLLQNKLSSFVAWVPDPENESLASNSIFDEEEGQIISMEFWKESHEIGILKHLKENKNPGLILQAETDMYVSSEANEEIRKNSPNNVSVEMMPNHSHSDWTYQQSNEILAKTVRFIIQNFNSFT